MKTAAAVLGCGVFVVMAAAGQPAPVVVIPREASGLEHHAARELAKYLQAMSAQDVLIATEGQEGGRAAIFVGRTTLGTATLPRDLAPEGFIVRATQHAGRPALIVAGQSDPATLYAAYYALEKLWGVGFFWDGEHISRVARWDWPPVDLREEPRFRIRQNLQGCAFTYSALHWGWDEWQAEVDWTVKHRFNALMLPWPSLDFDVWQSFGIALPPPSDYDHGRRELIQRVAAYARRLGVRCILPGYAGGVPAEFAKQHPEARLVDVKWGESAGVPNLFPSDPWFRRVGEAFVKAYAATYGTDHLYNIDPYPETRPGSSEQEQIEIKQAFADGVTAYLKAADPQAVWYASGWAFLDAGFWPPEAVSDFLSRIPAGSFYVNDIWAEANPIYQRLNYFDGHDWGFSVLHSFGGDDHLHGDLRQLAKRVQEVANDPRATRCIAFYINPEMIHYNVLYFELAARLGWAPTEVNVDRYLHEYAALRYGREAPPTALEAIRALAASVYGSEPGHEPVWQHRPLAVGLHPVDIATQGTLSGELARAAELLLSSREALGRNPLYQRDCLDVTRQYAAEVYNRLHTAAVIAFATGDVKRLDWCADQAERVTRLVEELLATRADYRVQTIVESALRAPGATPALERTIEDDMLTFAGTPWLIDYQSKDLQELLAGYYAPRVHAFYEELRARARRGDHTPPTAEEMLPKYEAIETTWLGTPVSKWTRVSIEEPAAAAGRLLAALHDLVGQLPGLALSEAQPGTAVGWHDDFDDVTRWHTTYPGGEFVAENGIASFTSRTKWCLVGTDLDAPLADYPVLSFRYRSEEPAKRGAWVWITWTDEAGDTNRSLVWNQGLSETWQEVHLDLQALLSLVGRPVRLREIELNNQEPPHVSQWDWMKLSARATAAERGVGEE